MSSTKYKVFSKQVKIAVWEHHCGKVYSHKCHIRLCSTIMKVSDFDIGHIVAYSRNSEDQLSNLLPICYKCNKSMGTMSIPDYNYSISPPGHSEPQIKDEINNYIYEPLIHNNSFDSKPKWFCCFR